MKSFLILMLLGISSLAQADAKCILPIFLMRPAGITPLQTEAEDVLAFRGYTIEHKRAEEFNLENMRSVEMFATAQTGTSQSTANKDCVMREFEDLGQFYTCHFDLRLFVYSSETSEFVEAFKVQAQTRDARSTDGFYQTVRRQLAQLPTCFEFSTKR